MPKVERVDRLDPALPRELRELARRIEERTGVKREDGILTDGQLRAAERAGFLSRAELAQLPKLREVMQRLWGERSTPLGAAGARESGGLGAGISITGPSEAAATGALGAEERKAPRQRVLVIDVSGGSVRVSVPGKKPFELPAGGDLTPAQLVDAVTQQTSGLDYDVVAIGYPGVVKKNAVAAEPKHLGPGWVGFDFAKALKRPVKLVNDAAMQALGSVTQTGVTLFIGVGTGLGVALVHSEKGPDGELRRRAISTELGHAHSATGREYEALLVQADESAFQTWAKSLRIVIDELRQLFNPDQVVIGGTHVRRFKNFREAFPDCTVVAGDVDFAFLGGRALWLGDV